MTLANVVNRIRSRIQHAASTEPTGPISPEAFDQFLKEMKQYDQRTPWNLRQPRGNDRLSSW